MVYCIFAPLTSDSENIFWLSFSVFVYFSIIKTAAAPLWARGEAISETAPVFKESQCSDSPPPSPQR